MTPTGLKYAPETGPSIRINTARPKTVAVLFSRYDRYPDASKASLDHEHS
jgi:hypothetical protein